MVMATSTTCPCPLEISTVVTLACDCDHKNAFFHRGSGVAPSSAKTMFLERVTGEPVMPVPTAIHFFSAVLDLLVFRNICSSKPSAHAVRRLRAASGPHPLERIRELPPGVGYMPKPWQPLNVLIAAEQELAPARHG
jgi:hypothetical protein